MKVLFCSLLTLLSLNPCVEQTENKVAAAQKAITTTTTNIQKVEKKLKSTKEIKMDLEKSGESVLYFCTFDYLDKGRESILDLVYSTALIGNETYLLERTIDLESETSFSKTTEIKVKNNIQVNEIFLVRNSLGSSVGLAYKKEENGLNIRNFKSANKFITSSFCTNEY